MQRWIKKQRVNEEKAKTLSHELPLSVPIIEYLLDHGYDTKEKIERFMNFQSSYLRDVYTMKDADKFIKRLVKAVKNKENITVYGDYDGDGVMATTIIVRTLRWLGLNPNFFISNRFTEGYGLSVKGMNRLIDTYPETQLVVTVDNGIAAIEGIAYAKEKGIEVIVSDHHIAKPDGSLPKCPVVCEKRLDENKEIIEEFCGAELARRLMNALVDKLGLSEEMYHKMFSLYAFSGFATITDIVPMNASNHFVTKTGLNKIKDEEYVCWAALREISEVKNFDYQTIGFRYGPMINAAARITGDATIPVKLCITDNIDEARKLAQELKLLNEQRQELSKVASKTAIKEIKENSLENNDFILVYGNDDVTYDEGIAGLVASDIVNNYGCAAVCLCPTTEDPNIYKGSGRSVGTFNIKEALDKCSDLLVGYGGHAMACGLTVKKENILPLMEKMNGLAKGIKDTVDDILIDYVLDGNLISAKLINDYDQYLAPFGPGFEEPVYAIVGYLKEINESSLYLTMKEKHIKTKINCGGNNPIDLLWFNGRHRFEEMNPSNGDAVACIGKPHNNLFNGRISTQFWVDKMREIKKEA